MSHKLRVIRPIICATLSFVLVLSIPSSLLPMGKVHAADYTFNINDGSVNESYSDDCTVEIIGSGSVTTNTVTIDVAAGKTVTVILHGVNIENYDVALKITGSGDVVVELEDDNILKSDHGAGLQKESSGYLTITGDGSLHAVGSVGGAGIGGSGTQNASNIVITGGTIIAESYASYDLIMPVGAGIGGGYEGNGSNIKIIGGTVTAKGYYTVNGGSAGIGGGDRGNGINIEITGGTVYAYGCAGIGGGCLGNASNIRISGGTVTAVGMIGSPGIGSGFSGSSDNISFSGGNVTAISEGGGAGIEGEITVSGEAILSVAGGAPYNVYGAGAAIGTSGGYHNTYGSEIVPDTSGLYSTGRIIYYPAGTTLSDITEGTAQSTSTTVGSLHAITVNTSGNGSASASVTHAASGTDIALTANPGNGYSFKEWQVSTNNVTITNNSFTMPDEAVTVTAVFEANPQNPAGSATGSAPTVVYESEPEPPVNDMQEVEDKISEAIALGGTRVVRIEGYPALSYHVLEMLQENPDVTLVSEFSYDGLEYRITIPGSKVKLDPSIKWYGPKYLFPMFFMYGTDTLPAVQAYLDKYEKPAS